MAELKNRNLPKVNSDKVGTGLRRCVCGKVRVKGFRLHETSKVRVCPLHLSYGSNPSSRVLLEVCKYKIWQKKSNNFFSTTIIRAILFQHFGIYIFSMSSTRVLDWIVSQLWLPESHLESSCISWLDNNPDPDCWW